jgi:hypothetical protein
VHGEAFANEATAEEITIALIVIDDEDDAPGRGLRTGRRGSRITSFCPGATVSGGEEPGEASRGLGDAGKIGKHLSGPQRLGGLPQRLRGRHDACHRIDDGPAERADITLSASFPPERGVR